VTVFAATAPISLDKPDIQKAASAYKQYFPKGVPQASVVAGWAEGEVMKQVLQKACDKKDLTREGMLSALRSINNLDTGGLIAAPMDFTQLGKAAEKAIYVTKPDANAAGGAKADGGPYTGPTAKAFDQSTT